MKPDSPKPTLNIELTVLQTHVSMKQRHCNEQLYDTTCISPPMPCRDGVMPDALPVGLQSPDPPDSATVHLLEGQTPAGSAAAAGPVSSELQGCYWPSERNKNSMWASALVGPYATIQNHGRCWMTMSPWPSCKLQSTRCTKLKAQKLSVKI